MKDKFQITREQIKAISISNFHQDHQSITIDLKSWFPEVFEEKLKNGVWYKSTLKKENLKNFLIRVVDIDNFKACGFSGYGDWEDEGKWCGFSNLTKASYEEIKEALDREAIKRGFVENAFVNNTCIDYCLKSYRINEKVSDYLGVMDILCVGDVYVYKQGRWATIVETITKEEAEKLLNKKII